MQSRIHRPTTPLETSSIFHFSVEQTAVAGGLILGWKQSIPQPHCPHQSLGNVIRVKMVPTNVPNMCLRPGVQSRAQES